MREIEEVKIKQTIDEVYCIAEKFGGEFNLAVWRSPTATPNLISAKLTSAISARKNYVLKFCFAIANRQI